MRSRLFFVFVLFAAWAGSGCDVVNPAETVPTYVQVDSFVVEPTNPFETGSVSHDIKSVWVYFDNQPVGVFDVPANVPIIANGPGMVQLVPAVNVAGTGDMLQYPFYEPDTFTIPFNPGSVEKRTARTRYRENARFRFKENFETGNSFIKVNDEVPTTIVRTLDKDKVFEGDASAILSLTTAADWGEFITGKGFSLPTDGQILAEINYKCSVPFEIGMFTITAQGQSVHYYLNGFYATDTWRKAYFRITDFVAANKGSEYNLMLKTALPEGQTEGMVLIDNIKIISF